MIAPFDIFRLNPPDDVLSIEAVPDLDIAKAHVAALMRVKPCEYLTDTKLE